MSDHGKIQISFVVAMDRQRLIGVDNHLPWKLPEDMKRFRQITIGKPVLIGRKTYESIPAKFRPLPDRLNIVLTRQSNYTAPGCVVVHSLEDGLRAAAGHTELMVIGGSNLYEQLLPLAGKIYLTLIDGEFYGDAYFPSLNMKEWREVFREEHHRDDRHDYNFTFIDLERIYRLDEPEFSDTNSNLQNLDGLVSLGGNGNT